MAVLDQLRITNVSPKRDSSPVGRFRRRLVDALELQLALAEADKSGVPFNRTREKWVKNNNGGKDLQHLPVRVRRWWWRGEDGKTYLSLKSGARPLEIEPGKRAIEIGTAEDLPNKLSILCDAVRAGELDACVNRTRSPKPSKAGKASTAGVKAAAKP